MKSIKTQFVIGDEVYLKHTGIDTVCGVVVQITVNSPTYLTYLVEVYVDAEIKSYTMSDWQLELKGGN